MSKWMVAPRTIGERTRYGVFRVIDSEGNTEVRGGLWDTEKEAKRLAMFLNKDEEAKHDRAE